MKRIAIFASGSGTNAENIIKYFRTDNSANVVLILSNNPDAFVLNRASRLNVKSIVFNKEQINNLEWATANLLNYNIDLIILAGYLWKFPAYLLKTYQNNWESVDSRPVPAWFEDAKFGIFIHWGLYSVPAYSPTGRDKVGVYDRYAEWYWRRWQEPNKVQKYFTDFHTKQFGADAKYQDFVKNFKAEMFQPDEWAQLFENAGAKYVVLTSKHHEGFTLWPSKQSWNWNAMDVGPHRDLLGDLTKSVKNKNIKMGYYYSLLEWYNPLYKKETLNEYIDQHMFPQMKDLVNTYHPDLVWTDGEWDYTSDKLRSTEFLSWLYNDSPVKNSVVVNDRWGKETRSKQAIPESLNHRTDWIQ